MRVKKIKQPTSQEKPQYSLPVVLNYLSYWPFFGFAKVGLD